MARPSREFVRNEQRISRIYQARCAGLQIDVMRIGDVFRIGHEAIKAGDDDKAIGDKIYAFALSIGRFDHGYHAGSYGVCNRCGEEKHR